jgi:hypothetical protein
MAKLTKKEIREKFDADRIVTALIDRLFQTEEKLALVQQQLKEHFEMIAELQPRLTPEGHIILRAMKADAAEVVEVEVPQVATGE